MRYLATLLAALPLMLVATVDAQAQYDLSGRWFVSGAFIILDTPEPYTSRHWDVVQSAGTLSVMLTDEDGNVTGPESGTINETTGAFQIGAIEGTVAAGGLTFSASRSGLACSVHTCVETETTYNGSRCGNGSIDGNEECDDDDNLKNDCCSPTCTADSHATACTSDGNICTDDVCDGAGTCMHEANSATCVGGPGGCSAGKCSAGACVASSFRAAGSSCELDADACTADTCDGAGTCTAGGPLDCSPCGVCESALGCVGYAEAWSDCIQEPGILSLKVGTGGGNRSKVSLDIEEHNVFYSFPSADLGDPTVDTDYTLCLYGGADSGPSPVLLRASMPAAGTCGDEPCWTRRDGSGGQLQFTYRNRDRTPDGIKSARIRRFGGISLRGGGGNLKVPAELSLDDAYLRPMVVADDGTTRKCWVHAVEPERLTPRQFKGSYSPVVQ